RRPRLSRQTTLYTRRLARPIRRGRLFSRSLGLRLCLSGHQWWGGLYSFHLWAGRRSAWARFSASSFGNVRARRYSYNIFEVEEDHRVATRHIASPLYDLLRLWRLKNPSAWRPRDLFRAICNCIYWKARWISTARGTDPYLCFSRPYIDLQSA